LNFSRNSANRHSCGESFELLLKYGKSSFLRKQESSLFKAFWIPAYAGMTKEGRFSKVSRKQESSPFNGFIDSRFRGNDKKVRFSKVSFWVGVNHAGKNRDSSQPVARKSRYNSPFSLREKRESPRFFLPQDRGSGL